MSDEAAEPNDEIVEPESPAGPEGEAAAEVVGTETLPASKSRKERAIERATAPLRERIRQLEANQPQPAAQAAPAQQRKPQRADFANDEAFEDAFQAWAVDKAMKEKARADAEADALHQHEANLRSYAAQVREAKRKYDDWDEVVNQEIFIGRDAQLAVLELENAAEVIYWLGQHPDKAAEIGTLSPVSAIRAVERLSLRLQTGAPSGEEYGYQRPRPKVPAPVRTVSTAGSSAAPSFADIAARPNYPGKAKDLKRALAERR